MEISNEIKAKVFAQYLGQKVITDVEMTERLEGVELDCIRTDIGIYHFSVHNDEVLVLRPLSAITDEDAIKCAKIYHGNSCDYSARSFKAVIEMLAEKSIVYQYLQSQGYDLPNYLLGGKTLQEAGLAIYE
jgi:hypothetical protein